MALPRCEAGELGSLETQKGAYETDATTNCATATILCRLCYLFEPQVLRLSLVYRRFTSGTLQYRVTSSDPVPLLIPRQCAKCCFKQPGAGFIRASALKRSCNGIKCRSVSAVS